jgi:hypothetical protein
MDYDRRLPMELLLFTAGVNTMAVEEDQRENGIP